ncbi:MAG: hypothetical protein ACT4O1_08065, partial [Gemmatimonadota bacterium]
MPKSVYPQSQFAATPFRRNRLVGKRSSSANRQSRARVTTKSIEQAQPVEVSLGQVLNNLLGRGDLGDCLEVRAAFPFDPRLVPQTRDLFNLFDTTPDLSGADIDIAPFIRDGEDLDVLVFWRDDDSGLGAGEMWKSGPRTGCPYKKLLPARDELCPVAAWRFRRFFKELNHDRITRVWRRDWRRGWVKLTDPNHIYPGQLFLLHADVGGYDPQLGWTGDVDSIPQPCAVVKAAQTEDDSPTFGEGTLDDEENAAAAWQCVHRHSVGVARELNTILNDHAIASALTAVSLK